MASTATRFIVARTLLFVYRSYRPALVEPAVRADPVGCLRLLTLRTHARGRRRERVVRAPLGAPRLGMSTFWIWHSCVHRRPSPGTYESRLTSPFRAARRGSSHSGVHVHVPVFQLVPHCGHSPLQSSRQSGFIGSAR